VSLEFDLVSNNRDKFANRTRRGQLIIPDDPYFELQFQLPEFEVDDDGNVQLANFSQSSSHVASQLSPLTELILSGSQNSRMGRINIPRTPSDAQGFSPQMPFGRDSRATEHSSGIQLELNDPFEAMPAFDDWGIEIDSDGNVIPIVENPDLPSLPGEVAGRPKKPHQIQTADEHGDVSMNLAEEPLPEAEAFQTREPEPNNLGTSGTEGISAPMRQQRARKRPLIVPDAITMVDKNTLKSWNIDYLTNQIAAAEKRDNSSSVTKARKLAWNMVFGRGIMEVGVPTGIPSTSHPLAKEFSGTGLAALLGVQFQDQDLHESQGARRSATAAGIDADDDETRSVRAKLEQQAHVGRNIEERGDRSLIFDQDDEVGRDHGTVNDTPASAPWNRPPSATHGSSIRGSAAKAASLLGSRLVTDSPLYGRGSILPEIERLSDQPNMGFNSLDMRSHSIDTGDIRDNTVADRESQNFLDFVKRIAKERGQTQAFHGVQCRWVAFEDVFEPPDDGRAVVTQAFFNVLSLASRNIIKVRQHDPKAIPYGSIYLGIWDLELEDEDSMELDG
jgi:meiotic recombination protein REC8